MITQVKAWGNSQGIRLSKELLALAEIKANDLLDISVIDGNIVLKKIENRHRTLEERAKEYGGKLGPYEEYTRSRVPLAGKGGSNGCWAG